MCVYAVPRASLHKQAQVACVLYELAVFVYVCVCARVLSRVKFCHRRNVYTVQRVHVSVYIPAGLPRRFVFWRVHAAAYVLRCAATVFFVRGARTYTYAYTATLIAGRCLASVLRPGTEANKRTTNLSWKPTRARVRSPPLSNAYVYIYTRRATKKTAGRLDRASSSSLSPFARSRAPQICAARLNRDAPCK